MLAGIIDTIDRRTQIESERRFIEEKLRRLEKAFVDGIVEEVD